MYVCVSRAGRVGAGFKPALREILLTREKSRKRFSVEQIQPSRNGCFFETGPYPALFRDRITVAEPSVQRFTHGPDHRPATGRRHVIENSGPGGGPVMTFDLPVSFRKSEMFDRKPIMLDQGMFV